MALIERYVRVDAAGGGDGTTDTNSGVNGAFTWVEFVTAFNVASPGVRFNIKKGDYFRGTGTDTLTLHGSAFSPKVIRGFNNTPGDLSGARVNGNGRLIVENYPNIVYTSGRFNVASNYTIIDSLQLISGTNNGTFTVGMDGTIINCSVSVSATGYAVITSTRGNVINCDCIQLPPAAGGSVVSAGLNGRIIGNYVTTTSTFPCTGISTPSTNAAPIILYNTIYNTQGTGIYIGNSSMTALIGNNTIVNCATGIWLPDNGVGLNVVWNNLITDNSKFGIYTGAPVLLFNNKYRNNTTSDVSAYSLSGNDWYIATNWNSVSSILNDPSQDFVDYSNQNFNLVQTSTAKENGVTKFTSIGALNPQQPARDESAVVFIM